MKPPGSKFHKLNPVPLTVWTWREMDDFLKGRRGWDD